MLDDLTDAEQKALARCRHAVLGVERPLRLDCGVDLGPYRVAYQTYGTLNADKSNAVLVCHALTGDQHVAGASGHRQAGLVGPVVGPGLPLDPARYFIICANVLGGCMGSTGPLAIDPGDRPAPWASISRSSPSATWCARRPCCSIISASDLFAVAGGSMGGMQVLQWAASYPGARVLGAADRRGRRAIRRRTSPSTRSAARRSWPIPTGAAATTSRPGGSRRAAWRSRAWPRTSPICPSRPCSASSAASCRTATALSCGFDADFQVESYLRHQGLDLRRPLRRQLLPLHHPRHGLFRPGRRARRRAGQGLRGRARLRFCVISFTSDWLYPTPRAARSCAR